MFVWGVPVYSLVTYLTPIRTDIVVTGDVLFQFGCRIGTESALWTPMFLLLHRFVGSLVFSETILAEKMAAAGVARILEMLVVHGINMILKHQSMPTTAMRVRVSEAEWLGLGLCVLTISHLRGHATCISVNHFVAEPIQANVGRENCRHKAYGDFCSEHKIRCRVYAIKWSNMELRGAPSSTAANQRGNEDQDSGMFTCSWEDCEYREYNFESVDGQAAHWLREHALIKKGVKA